MDDSQRQAILDEIVAMSTPRQQRDFEFTRREYQEHAGLTQCQARSALEGRVRNGQLKCEMVFVAGHWSWVYWRPEDEAQATRD